MQDPIDTSSRTPHGIPGCPFRTESAVLLLSTLTGLSGCFQVPSTVDTSTDASSGTETDSTTQVGSTGTMAATSTMGSTSGTGVTSSMNEGGSTSDVASTSDDGSTDTGAPPPPDTCGNGTLDPDEECDDGSGNGPGALCHTNCTRNVCGDGDVSPMEGCDDGNTADDDGCSASCHSESCGNARLDGSEECDDGANDDQDDGCTNLCRLPSCGDGFEQPNEGELCDDGNNNDFDACVEGCVPATCGDGYAWTGHEACDDGNVVNTDSCLVGCHSASCGDGYLREGFEECDDDGNANGDGCSSICQEELGWSCNGSECDTICGDGIVAGEECCDDGNETSGDMCPGNCTLTERRVFVSSAYHTGDFNGIAEADIFCQFLANEAGLPGSYRAWLSTDTSSPANDWIPSTACNVPYRRVDGVTVAITWADLTDGTLMAPINVTESGPELSTIAWTGTEPDGTASEMNTCHNWNSDDYPSYGTMGYTSQTNNYWTNNQTQGCWNEAPIYCFEH